MISAKGIMTPGQPGAAVARTPAAPTVTWTVASDAITRATSAGVAANHSSTSTAAATAARARPAARASGRGRSRPRPGA
ncbi:MAG TPA: hypothetical protein VKB57_21850, partial [Acidimicrobiales bacterium]|nr:hypothetical protein [Acidimicrobiales bacterium]